MAVPACSRRAFTRYPLGLKLPAWGKRERGRVRGREMEGDYMEGGRKRRRDYGREIKRVTKAVALDA
jgi:hypothetical protein